MHSQREMPTGKFKVEKNAGKALCHLRVKMPFLCLKGWKKIVFAK